MKMQDRKANTEMDVHERNERALSRVRERLERSAEKRIARMEMREPDEFELELFEAKEVEDVQQVEEVNQEAQEVPAADN